MCMTPKSPSPVLTSRQTHNPAVFNSPLNPLKFHDVQQLVQRLLISTSRPLLFTVVSEWHHHYLNLNSAAFPLPDPATTQSIIESSWLHLCCVYVCVNLHKHLLSLSQILFLSLLNKPPNRSPTPQIHLQHCWPGSLMCNTTVPAPLHGDNGETCHLRYARHSYEVFIHANPIYPNHSPLS